MGGKTISVSEFRSLIFGAYEKDKRSFPWRENTEPWGILVSELMLQQTQAERVVPYWNRWMDKWPCPEALNAASLGEVLREWSGLGYNRRGKYLKECAGVIVRDMNGIVPCTPDDLAKLPGIGPYTAGAVACFAYNFPSVFIETNIRSVMLHFFFPGKEAVTDREIMPIIKKTLDTGNPGKWYWALMDYGAALKKISPNPGRRSARYNRQSAFSGSFRQIRGSLIRVLISGESPAAEELLRRVKFDLGAELNVQVKEDDFYRALETLCKESLVAEEGGKYRISG
jgi:A/G-specific adenine glycosylase